MPEVALGGTEYYLSRENVVIAQLSCETDQKPNTWELKELVRRLVVSPATSAATTILSIECKELSSREVAVDLYARTLPDAQAFALKLDGHPIKLAGLKFPYRCKASVRTEMHPLIDADTIEWRRSLFEKPVSQSTFEQEFRFLEPGNRPDTISILGWPSSLIFAKGKFNDALLLQMFGQFGSVKRLDHEYKDVLVEKDKKMVSVTQIELLVQYEDFGSFVTALRMLNQRVLRKRNAPVAVRYQYDFKCFGRMTDTSIRVRKFERERREAEEAKKREEERIAEETRKRREQEEQERKIREQREQEERKKAAEEEERKRKEREEELNRRLKVELEQKKKEEADKKRQMELEARRKQDEEKKRREEKQREEERKEAERKRKADSKNQKEALKRKRKDMKLEQLRVEEEIKYDEQKLLIRNMETQFEELRQLSETKERYWPHPCEKGAMLVDESNQPVDLVLVFHRTPQYPRILTASSTNISSTVTLEPKS
eukprot:TRINITY_DN17811_c0_g1_i1.p1 TRINITY_DN17811_c0_g1~~TRINITY_DN17811_c0_g1_i1.p1  ORF type:complete len:488 (+),score=106.79 TRINITY_DN17811_c0_g1_i1:60-1523(+)